MAPNSFLSKHKTTLWTCCYVLAILIFVLFIFGERNKVIVIPTGKKAIFDYRQTDFGKTKCLKMHGEVAYWKDTLIDPSNISATETLSTSYEKIPGRWNAFKIGGKNANGSNYGTVYFKIQVPNNNPYAIKIPHISSAYEIWANNKYLGGSGKVSSDKESMVPNRARKEFSIVPFNNNIEIVIHFSNFRHNHGGLTKTLLFGPDKEIQNLTHSKIRQEMFLLGILIILWMHHLMLFHLRTQDRTNLIFSYISLSALLRMATTGEKLILDIFPSVSFNTEIRLEFLSLFILSFTLVYFISKLFPNDINKKTIQLYGIITLFFIITALFLPTTILTQTVSLFQFISIPFALYVVCMNYVAILRKRPFAIPIFNGTIFFFFMAINDILHYQQVIDTFLLMPYGLVVLILSQSYVLSKENTDALNETEALSRKLEKNNAELELRVQERTSQIEEQKEEIETQKENIEKKVEELDKTNNKLKNLLSFKNDITNMMVHDLKSPLGNIIGFTNLNADISKYKDVINASGIEMQNLIRNILDVDKYKDSRLDLHIELHDLNQIANKAYQINHYSILKNNITFENNIPSGQWAKVDGEIMERVFANIISNATKYNNKNGIIRINSQSMKNDEGEFRKVEIYNSGDTIPADRIELIFSKHEQVYAQKGEFSYSTGIGLTYCLMAIESHGGTIGVRQETKKGVTFWFTLPI